MRSLSTCLAALALAIPAAARADPVTITTHSSGMMTPFPLITDRIWGAGSLDYSQPAAFDLTISAVFDPNAPTFSDTGYFKRAVSQVDVNFMLGGMGYHYHGIGTVTIANSAGYEQVVSFPALDMLSFSNRMTDPAGPSYGELLQPVSLAGSGWTEIVQWPDTPDAPSLNSMSGPATSTALQVVGAVPEPSGCGMLAGGCLVVLLWRRRVRARA